MQKMKKVLIPVIFLLIACVFIGCSEGGGSSDAPAIESTPFYSPNAAVNALPYDEVADIKLFIRDDSEEAGFSSISDGDYVGPMIQTFGITVSPNREGERVYVSDGANLIQEAFLDENGYYVCDFEFDADLYPAYPLLIQVIYTDGTASKRKYVLSTDENYRAGVGRLVQQGLGIVVGKNILEEMSGAVASLLGSALGANPEEVMIHNFSAADNSSGDPNGVLHLEATIPTTAFLSDSTFLLGVITFLKTISFGLIDLEAVDLNCDLLINDTQDGQRGLFLGIEDVVIVAKIFGDLPISLTTEMLDALSLDLGMAPVSLDLGELLGGLGGDEGDDDLLGTLLGDLNLAKLLFLNVFGVPEDTTKNHAALGGGLFVAETDTVATELVDGEEEYIFPVVVQDNTQEPMDLDLLKPSGDNNMGIGLAHYNLNQFIGNLVDGLEIQISALTTDAQGVPEPLITLAVPAWDPGVDQKLRISMNPAGIGIDLAYQTDPSAARMDIMDMSLEYVENGNAMWQMSLDISLELELGVSADGVGGLALDLALTPIPELCRTHVMRDNMSIGIFDHSPGFISSLFAALAGMMEDGTAEPVEEEMEGPVVADALVISLPLSDFGLKPKSEGDAGAITYDGKGNCFMNLALDSVDTSGFCFISTAGSF